MVKLLLSLLLYCAISYVPGYCLARPLIPSRYGAIACAPLFSIAVLLLFGAVLGFAGVSGWAATTLLICGLLLSSAVCLFLFPRCSKGEYVPGAYKFDICLLLLYMGVSLTVSALVYLRGMGGADALFQQCDNGAHLASVLEMAEDGNYSFFRVSTYSLTAVADWSAPVPSVGFYPCGFYVVASLAVSLLGVTAPVAINAAIVFFAGIAYPVAMFAFLRKLFKENSAALIAGSIASQAFAAFPFALCSFGPLYPNMASMCLLPAVCWLFVENVGERKPSPCFISAFVICCAAECLLQPNSLFTAGVFLAPYCCHKLFEFVCSRMPKRARTPYVAVLLLVLAFVGLWALLYFCPAFSGVVSFYWPGFLGRKEGIANVVSLALRLGTSQLYLAVLVIIGLFAALGNKRTRWLAVSFLLMCFIYYVDMTDNGVLKHVVSGFWYTDQWRTAACVGFAGVPIASLGVASLCRFACDAFAARDENFSGLVVRGAIVIFSCLAIFSPVNIFEWPTSDSAFEVLAENFRTNSTPSEGLTYTDAEAAFVQEVKEAVPEDALILNMPNDGSFFAYLSGDLNLYYRTNRVSDDTVTSRTLRTELFQADSNQTVRKALKDSGCGYVLLLSKDGFVDQGNGSYWSLAGSYSEADWTGFDVEKLDDCSLLETVLSQGDMRLYRIKTEEL